MESDEESRDRSIGSRRLLLAAPLLVVGAFATAAAVRYGLAIPDVSALDPEVDVDLRPVAVALLAAATVAAVLVGIAASAGALLLLRPARPREQRVTLLVLAAVSGITSAILLVPTGLYVAVVFLNRQDDPPIWEMGWFAVLAAALGAAGLFVAVYEAWLASSRRVTTVTTQESAEGREDVAGRRSS